MYNGLTINTSDFNLPQEKKHNTSDLEILLELDQNEVTHIWDCLHAWADKQMTAFVASEEPGMAEAQEQGEKTADNDTDNTQKVSSYPSSMQLYVFVHSLTRKFAVHLKD